MPIACAIVEVAVLVHPTSITLLIIVVEATTTVRDKTIVWPRVTSQTGAHQAKAALIIRVFIKKDCCPLALIRVTVGKVSAWLLLLARAVIARPFDPAAAQ
jgi:hypothetical protein